MIKRDKLSSNQEVIDAITDLEMWGQAGYPVAVKLKRAREISRLLEDQETEIERLRAENADLLAQYQKAEARRLEACNRWYDVEKARIDALPADETTACPRCGASVIEDEEGRAQPHRMGCPLAGTITASKTDGAP